MYKKFQSKTDVERVYYKPLTIYEYKSKFYSRNKGKSEIIIDQPHFTSYNFATKERGDQTTLEFYLVTVLFHLREKAVKGIKSSLFNSFRDRFSLFDLSAGSFKTLGNNFCLKKNQNCYQVFNNDTNNFTQLQLFENISFVTSLIGCDFEGNRIQVDVAGVAGRDLALLARDKSNKTKLEILDNATAISLQPAAERITVSGLKGEKVQIHLLDVAEIKEKENPLIDEAMEEIANTIEIMLEQQQDLLIFNQEFTSNNQDSLDKEDEEEIPWS